MRETAAIKSLDQYTGRLKTCYTDNSLWVSDGSAIIRISDAGKVAKKRWYDGTIDMSLAEDVKYHLQTSYPLVWHTTGISLNAKSLFLCGNAVTAAFDKLIKLFPGAEFRSYWLNGGSTDIAIYEDKRLMAIIPSYRLTCEEQEIADKIGEMLDGRVWNAWKKINA